ncbi:MAG TPA: ABC transporter permease [Thermoanaerobacterales bacterium]|nr:ABC transporter permease [Thermoanaerobacterales bacterium]
MWSYIVRRILLGILVLFGVITITFFLVRVVPSNPAARWVGPRATAQQIAQAEKELGLDKPLYVQYGKYISGLARGDWGYSIRTRQPVIEDLKAYIPATLELVIISMLLALVLGIPLGVIAAVKQNRWPDHFCRFFSVGSVSLPTFWLGMTLQLLFFRTLGILPIGGRMSEMARIMYPVKKITGLILFDSLITGNQLALIDASKHIILPCLTLAAYPIGLVARMTRSSLLEVLNEDYIRAARAYGLPERMVVLSYALKNALGPTITVLALSAGYSLVNTFLIEAIFNWPGLGSYTSLSVITSDYTAVMGVTIFTACSYVFLNLVADLLLAIDPRVRL